MKRPLALILLLIPLAVAQALAQPDQTIVEVASQSPDFSTLVNALEAASLSETLRSEGPFTVFAPTNSAFARLSESELSALLEDREALRNVLSYHVVPGRFTTSDITADMQAFETLQGSELPITQEGVGTAAVTAVNIEASNGVIYAVDTVLTPPAGAAGDRDADAADTGETGEPLYSSTAERSVRYPLSEMDDSGVSGSVLIAEYSEDRSVVTVSLTGTPAGGTHPAFLTVGSCDNADEVLLPLEAVSGDVGLSSTTLDLPFDTLVERNYALNVFLSEDEETVVACGEVGEGADAGESGEAAPGTEASPETVAEEEFNTARTESFDVAEVGGSGVSGAVQVTEDPRTGGARVAITLEGTPDGGVHPAHFHVGDCGSNGPIVVPLNNVNGDSGSSVTETEASFEEITESDHYINIHLSPEDLGTIVACGEVGPDVNQ